MTVLVIGGGAAGMMAAVTAASCGHAVLVMEHQPKPLRKLCITGKGRCNLTNNCDLETFWRNVPGNPRFLYSSVSRFTPQDVMAFFEGLGVPLKTERGSRVFPVSDRAYDIADALVREARRLGVRMLEDEARGLVFDEEESPKRVIGARTSRGVCFAQHVIVATGGISYPLTGSTGMGYELARQAGHTIVPPRASLVPLTADTATCGAMQGLSLKNTGFKLYKGSKLIYEDFGELLFTHFGLSGPVVLSASARMKDESGYRVVLDLKPALEEKQLDARILRDFGEQGNRDLGNALGGLLPRLMIPVVMRRMEVAPSRKVNSITREERLRLVSILKRFEIEVTGKRPVEEAVITAGGVSVREVDPKTMASKKVRGLSFAGEVLDVDAYTGGFNLQIAWSTGRAAGMSLQD
ncbi:MAG: NAD(P)/FAD-dependent oxidoreductase [Clostridia bacterium]|nr:NAD(P)/FAD-dependent oxidoreductase [Oscillospiraceae bacterium]MBR6747531.1 NAD(P)/FAD-dependent oxidoreductase [Clostridia bacterium]